MSRIIVTIVMMIVAGPVWGQASSKGEGFFAWKVVPGTRLCELYAAGHKIGLYDPDERAYYRIDPDGTRTGPVAPPFPIRTSNGTIVVTRTTAKATSEPSKDREKDPGKEKATESVEERPWYQDLPAWTTYAVGGVITLLITGIGLAMQFRRT